MYIVLDSESSPIAVCDSVEKAEQLLVEHVDSFISGLDGNRDIRYSVAWRHYGYEVPNGGMLMMYGPCAVVEFHSLNELV